MPLSLQIKSLCLVDPAFLTSGATEETFWKNSPWKTQMLGQLRSQLTEIIKIANKDLLFLVEEVGTLPEDPLMNEVLIPLSCHVNRIVLLPESDVQFLLKQQMRMFALILRNRLDIFPLSSTNKVTFQTFLNAVDTDIGTVPVLNRFIVLPEPKFLPDDFERSCARWKLLPYKDPGRKTTSRINFFQKKKMEHKWLPFDGN